MPFVWAKQTNLFEDINHSDMFYPQGLALSRKEKLSLIWLAANYDPDKYKKIVPARDCEGANIARICYAIMNPAYPYALRLSAQLLLGTVRVYRTKAKLLLELAEQMMLKLSTLIKEANASTFDMAVPVLRAEAITIADTGMSMIDYSLEPIYYDPQMIMHMNEEDFITINRTPMHSPIKLEKAKKPDKSPAKIMRSPLVVSNRQISIDEDLLSPNRPIQVPGEEDFGLSGFGPAQDDFFNDLNLGGIPDLRFEEQERLAPVFEDEEDEIIIPIDIEFDSRKRKAEDIVLEQEVEGEAEPIDLDQLLQDVLTMTMPGPIALEDKIAEQGRQTDSDDAQGPVMEIATESNEKQTAAPGVEATVVGVPHDWEENLITPADAIVLKPRPSHPKKKRKLQVDKDTILQSHDIRNNLSTPETLIRVPIIAGTALPGAKALFKTPIITGFHHPKLNYWWENNTCVVRKPNLHEEMLFHEDIRYNALTTAGEESEEEEIPPRSPEVARKHDETPGSIGIQRSGSTGLPSFEQSAGSTLLVNQTPVDDGSLLKAIDRMVDTNLDDPNLDPRFGPPDSPRISGIGLLPQDIDVDLDLAPELELVIEQDETLIASNIEDTEVEDNDESDMSKHFQVYQKRIYSAMFAKEGTRFHDIFPASKMKRRKAALAFYTALNLHKNGFLRLNQVELFGEITMTRV